MPHPPHTREKLQQGLDLYYECEKNWAEMARRWDRSRSACQHLVARARQAGLTPRETPKADVGGLQSIIDGLRSELDKTRLERDEAHASLRIATKPRFVLRNDVAPKTSKVRVVCIGDAHDSPAIEDKSRFAWIAKYIKDTKPDIVIQIGDFATLDSLNTHVGNETYHGRAKPTFINDMVSFNKALEAMQIDGPEKHCTLGNHERRLYAFEDRAPEAYGMMQHELHSIFERHGWTFSPYGMPYVVGGVSFVHCALNTLSKSYGGKNAEGTIANDAIGDWVIGHSHRERMHRAPKLGLNNYVKIINVGCALPDGHIESYATHSLAGWSYGIADMLIQHGHVQDYAFVSMGRLGEQYGSKV